MVGSYMWVQFDVDPNKNQDLVDLDMLSFKFDIGLGLIDFKGECWAFPGPCLPFVDTF